MLTGEYLALDNALVLTLPTKFGQSLTVTTTPGTGKVTWKSLTNKAEVWFSAELFIGENSAHIETSSDEKIAKTLIKVLDSAIQLSKTELTPTLNYAVTTLLEFPQNWGLGSSSTLINNIAQWFKIDAFELHFSVFNGSGYDVAAAYSNSAITYQINHKQPLVEQQLFNPEFKNHLFFVHLNQKQNSFNAVKNYQENKDVLLVEKTIQAINKITKTLLKTDKLKEFEQLLSTHEDLLATVLKTPTIQHQLFSDYQDGIVKSLGAWGGDFILVTGNEKSKNYFRNKGYETILSYEEMIL